MTTSWWPATAGCSSRATAWRPCRSGRSPDRRPNVPAHELRWHKDTHTLYVATFGRGIWRIDLPELSNATTHAGTWYGPGTMDGVLEADGSSGLPAIDVLGH